MKRWLQFNAIGIIGAAVQLLALRLLIGAGTNYLAATALAVELAIIHNYFWHLRWTWRDRPASRIETFLRFQLANGAVSLISNVVLMRLLAGHLQIPPVPANLIAIAITSVVNYLLGDRWVFREALPSCPRVLSAYYVAEPDSPLVRHGAESDPRTQSR